jgi:hypothetical protein
MSIGRTACGWEEWTGVGERPLQATPAGIFHDQHGSGCCPDAVEAFGLDMPKHPLGGGPGPLSPEPCR